MIRLMATDIIIHDWDVVSSVFSRKFSQLQIYGTTTTVQNLSII
jgi:hypothetical protein